MLRNSHSPALSNRPSPPITRSASRIAQLVIGNSPLEHSTPKRFTINEKKFQTIERHHEIADDDDDDIIEQNNSSKLHYKNHFSVKERLEMYFAERAQASLISWRAFRRRFIPSLSTLKDAMFVVILIAIMTKYVIDNYASITVQTESTLLKTQIEKLEQKITEMIDRQQLLVTDLNEMQKFHNYKDKESDKFFDMVGSLEQKLTRVHNEIEQVKSEALIAKDLLGSIKNTPSEIQTTVTIPPNAPFKRSLPGVNVANSLLGATIDENHSSRAVSAKNSVFYDILSYMITFKRGYVLLDRDVTQPGEAWCTYDKKATLTVNLARHILPIAVSYQHLRWNGMVPNHAPRVYDVVACHSICCTESTTLVSKCQYSSSQENDNSQEQICYVENKENIRPINRVQFRFRENHGNMTKTCAYLVRVYGEPVDVPMEKSENDPSGFDIKSVLFEYLAPLPIFNTD